ncbi:hypothetical protein Hamer_G022516 [Homarus americanus]|uniref:Uncharacterized protein n=1 Tax=Homarus americanus TaxID=6706 RepID=A0A8J5NCQ8_HOMAM|nr:hypothetical protein Hamer_G022516 [Homarus americanus]
MEGCNRKGKKAIVYPNLRSAMCPVGHSTDIPVPQPPAEMPSGDAGNSEESESDGDSYKPQPESGKKQHLITQPEFNDLVRDLALTKQRSELLAYRSARMESAGGRCTDNSIQKTLFRFAAILLNGEQPLVYRFEW